MKLTKFTVLSRARGFSLALMGTLLLAANVQCADTASGSNRVTVPLHDPSRPGMVKVKLSFGSINVKGYDGKEIIVETRAHKAPPDHAGAPNGVKIDEEDNVVSIKAARPPGPFEMSIQVPFKTSLQLGSPVDGMITVENVEGEIEANNVNGGIVLSGVSGSIVAHCVNGKVQARLEKCAPGKPMSISSVNGGIDVILPADTAANIKMATVSGRADSEFTIDSDKPPRKSDRPASHPVPGKAVSGPINGGGPDFQFRTVNGSIHLRKNTK